MLASVLFLKLPSFVPIIRLLSPWNSLPINHITAVSLLSFWSQLKWKAIQILRNLSLQSLWDIIFLHRHLHCLEGSLFIYMLIIRVQIPRSKDLVCLTPIFPEGLVQSRCSISMCCLNRWIICKHVGWRLLVDETDGRQGPLFSEWISGLVKKMKQEHTIQQINNNCSGSFRLQSKCVWRWKQCGVLISLPGFAKNQEAEISDFKMSHWKQVVFKEHTLKFKPGGTEGGRKTWPSFRPCNFPTVQCRSIS